MRRGTASRNLAKQLIVEQELQRAGVRIEYVLGEYPDTPEGRLNKHIKATIAEYEREKIAERTKRARRRKVADGHVMVHGRPPYGYRVVEVHGKRTLAICEAEARVVRMIFDWYTVGDGQNAPLSVYGIAQRLTENHIPTPGDEDPRIAKQRERGEWNKSTVFNLLRRETYAGLWHYGKTRMYKGRQVRTPRGQWIPVVVPAIVSRETWEAAQVQLQKNKDSSPRNTRREYLLRRRVVCRDCGAKMNVTSRRNGKYLYYRCESRYALDSARECSIMVGFRADHVDTAVWDWVKSFLIDPVALAEGLRTEQEEREEASRPLRDRLAVVDDLLADNQRQLERLLDLYLSDDFPKELLTERQERLYETLGALERERADLVARLAAQTLTDEQVQTIAEFAQEVAQGLEKADNDFAARRQLIEMLDVRATLAVEDGQKVAYVRCMMGDDAWPIASTSS